MTRTRVAHPVDAIEHLLAIEGMAPRGPRKSTAGAAGAARGGLRPERGARRDPRTARAGGAAEQLAARLERARRRSTRSVPTTRGSLQELSSRMGRANVNGAASEARDARRASRASFWNGTTSTTCSPHRARAERVRPITRRGIKVTRLVLIACRYRARESRSKRSWVRSLASISARPTAWSPTSRTACPSSSAIQRRRAGPVGGLVRR